ncbi:VOC family protein [Enterococcus alishanensis]|uniref:VOC family protein n=1 Tax=Enterococcus alishanensis TaxID=1303817 RepID=A0ABS6TGQ6_9ENTE|nr:VOC family protein [Enterococcus alishanensis]MBV7392118.1 VOC family protein [Enterococcus alishanensis]
MSEQRVIPFLTFNGEAKAALEFYAENLPEAEVVMAEPYGTDNPHMPAEEGQRIMYGMLSLLGQKIMFLDMASQYPAPDFNWASSLYLECQDEAEFDLIFAALSKEGSVMMGPESVGNIRKCAWVVDKFGVTWQPVWV